MYRPVEKRDIHQSNKPKALYLRKSKKKKGKTEEETLESNMQRLLEFCKKNEIDDYVIYNDFVAKSTKLDRIEYRKMLNACLQGEHDTIVVLEESRLYRTVYEQTNVYEDLKGTDIVIFSDREGIINPNDRTQFLANIVRGAVNEHELHNYAHRMNQTKLQTAKNGSYVNKIPFGYIKVRNKLIPHPVESKAFRLIVEKVIEGYPIKEVIIELNLRGYTTKQGKKFKAATTITRLFENRVYLGESHYNSQMFGEDVIIRDTHEPLMTIEEYQKIKKTVGSRSRNKQGIRYTKINTPLDRLMYCGICGHRLPIHKSYKNKEGITSYQISNCKNSYGENFEHKCPHKSVSLNFLLPHFYKVISKYKEIIREEIVNAPIDNTNDKKIAIMQDIKLLDKKIKEKEEEIENTDMYLIKGILKETKYVKIMPQLEKELKELKSLLLDTNKRLEKLDEESSVDLKKKALDFLQTIEDIETEEQNRQFRLLFDKVVIINTDDKFSIELIEKDTSLYKVYPL
ncbi:recombinase family protein [Lysinibacillus sp. NPDC093216]|uniref:recombinase family protein n=1 Tax=Lysinibacillus sp. NPDC093216 TaxID=3390576 RepID=UPI003D076526